MSFDGITATLKFGAQFFGHGRHEALIVQADPKFFDQLKTISRAPGLDLIQRARVNHWPSLVSATGTNPLCGLVTEL